MKEIIAYYKRMGAPQDQNALIALLKEVQSEHNGIPMYAISEIVGEMDIKESLLLALVRRIPSLRLSDSHLLEICAGPNCGKRTELTDFVEKTYGKKPTGFTLRYCGCMRQCGKGPNIRWDGKLYNAATPELIRSLIEDK